MFSNQSQPIKQQQGIAAVLLVVLLSIALTATSFGMMHVLRNTQEKNVAVHAAVHAQNGAWAAAEALRLYLNSIDATTIGNLNTGGTNGTPITFSIPSDNTSSIVAKFTDVTETPPGSGIYRVSAELTNIHNTARASAALGVTFEVSPGSTSPNPAMASLDFYDDLNVTGGIQLITPSGTLPDINVDGNVNIDQLTITDIGKLNATGSVSLGSGVDVDTLYSNDNVSIKDTVHIDEVTTLGTYTAAGSAYADVVWANGDVTINSAGFHSYVNTMGKITVTMGDQGVLKAGDDVTIGASAGGIDQIYTTGDVAINPWQTFGPIVAEGNLTACPGTTWGDDSHQSILVNGTVAASCPESDEIVAGANESVSVMTARTAFQMGTLVINVWSLKDDANYVLEWDDTAARMKVTVYDIVGQTDGTEFYVGNYTSTLNEYNSFLCTEFDEFGVCSVPTEPEMSICLGHSPQNSCISYDPDTETWDVNGKSTAPGIMWFEGNVNLNNGHNYTTILATGDVTTGGAYRGYSANYAAYDEVCLATGSYFDPVEEADIKAIYTARYSAQYPTNLCDIENAVYIPVDTGNIGIAAGGTDPLGTGDFSGGNINLGALTEIWGAVLAGEILTTGGATSVYGYITAAAQGTPGTADNQLGGATIVDLTKGSDTYDPNAVPGMTTTPTPPTPASNETRLLWSKYL